jgi:predicted alpha/beta-hydrolase family hydrolase
MPVEGRVALNLISVDTPAGVAQAVVEPPRGAAKAVLVLGHGAGGDIEAPDLLALSTAAVAAGVAVVRVRQPYRVAGRRAPAPARQLDAAWVETVNALTAGRGPFQPHARKLRGRPVVVAGRSSGARVACRTAAACGAAGVVALAFPLHPPGKPEKSRADELRIEVPLLVVQGDRDAFGRPAEFPRKITLIEVPGADHGLKAASFEDAAARVVAWVTALAG